MSEPRERELFGFDLDDDSWLQRVGDLVVDRPLLRLGDYEAVERVSQGAQGAVYRARQRGTDRTVALKRLLSGDLSSAEARARFEREVAAAARLDHGCIVKIWSTDVVDGQPLIAMEWVDGQPLTRWAANEDGGGRRSLGEVLDCFERVCEAVQHAHQRGVLHRDLKPSNVLVDGDGRPRIVDFGVAKLMQEEDDEHLTRSGDFVGTPAYAAPEQLTLGAQALDVRGDVYSLGVLLFELLAGRLPYEIGAGVAADLRTLAEAEPLRLRQLAPHIGGELEAIVHQCLRKEPENRYQSVDALLGDLRRYRGGEAVLAHAPSAWYQLRKFVGRHRAASALSAVVVLLIAAFAIYAAIQAARIATERNDAIEARKREAQSRAALADTVTLIRRTFATLQPAALSDRSAVFQIVEQVRARMREQFASYPQIRADLHSTLGNLLLGLAYRAPAAEELRAATILFDAALPDRTEACALAHLGLGRALAGQTEYGQARTHLQRAVDLLRAADTTPIATLTAAEGDLAGLLIELGEVASAERLLERALAQGFAGIAEHQPRLLEHVSALARVRLRRGAREAAFALITGCLSNATEKRGADDAVVGAIHRELGQMLVDDRQFVEAEKNLLRARDVALAVFGREHPAYGLALGGLGRLRWAQGRIDDAERVLGQAHGVLTADAQAPARGLESVLRSLADLYEHRGELDRAVEVAREVVSITRRLGTLHARIADALTQLGLLLGRLGQSDAALMHLLEAADMRRKLFARTDPVHAETLDAIGVVATARDERWASSSFERALDLLSVAFPDGHPSAPRILVHYADWAARAGYPATRAEHARRALEMADQLGFASHDRIRVAACAHLAEFAVEREDWQRAQAWIAELTDLDRLPVPTLLLIGKIQSSRKNYRAAVPFYERARAELVAAKGASHAEVKVIDEWLAQLRELAK